MDPSHLDELISLEEKYWWHLAKRKLVSDLVQKKFPAPARIAEGGIGSSRNLLEFKNLGYDVAGFDLMQDAVDFAKQRKIEDVHVHDLTKPWPLQEQSVDAVLMLDVLEHLPNPVEVMKHASQVLKSNGAIIFTVPCYQWLYGEWDKKLGHFRRYTRKMMRKQVADANLKVEWLNHWNAFTLPAAVAVRGIQKLLPSKNQKPNFPRVSNMMNRTLLGFASMERWWLNKALLPAGLSMVGILRK